MVRGGHRDRRAWSEKGIGTEGRGQRRAYGENDVVRGGHMDIRAWSEKGIGTEGRDQRRA